MLSWQFWQLFLKVLMRQVLTRCKIVLWYRFRQNENGKLLKWDFFALLPLKFIFTSYVKCFSKTYCSKSSLFCDFSNWKHVRTTATCKNKIFSSRKFLKTMFCYFWKIRSQSNDFYHPIRTFAINVFRVSRLKANMNSYIQLRTAAIFFSIEPLSKTGYWLGVCHGWFHLQGLTGSVKNASWVRITKLKSLAHSGIRTRDLPLTKRARYHWATKADVNRVD